MTLNLSNICKAHALALNIKKSLQHEVVGATFLHFNYSISSFPIAHLITFILRADFPHLPLIGIFATCAFSIVILIF